MIHNPKHYLCNRYCAKSTLVSLRSAIDDSWLVDEPKIGSDKSVSPQKVIDFDLSSVDSPQIQENKELSQAAIDTEAPVNNCEILNETSEVKRRRYSSPYSFYGAIDIGASDLACLEEGKWLNDVIVDFYMEHLLATYMTNRRAERIFCLSSLASPAVQRFDRRTSGCGSVLLDAYKAFEPFTKRIDLFSKDFVLFPLSLSYHWILVIICYPSWLLLQGATSRLYPDRKCCILIFDSFGASTRSSSTAQRLRGLLEEEWKAKKVPLGHPPLEFKSTTIPLRNMKVPLQMNCSDCGLFVLHYAETFLKHLFSDDKFSLSKFCVADLTDWFPLADIERKRSDIKNMVLKLPIV
uniref:ULP_PROTEASE domain-containing protein n=1 Tax=Trichuris muris TaxID=70415 RepID=A0A5S6Q0E9_TRIMR